MSEIQRRGGVQLEALLKRFGIPVVLPGAELIDAVLPIASVPRLDNLCCGLGSVAALASNRSVNQILNPAKSNVRVTLIGFWCSTTAPGGIDLRMHNPELGTPIGATQVLRRVRGNQPEPSCQLFSTQGAGVGNTAMRWAQDIADRSYWYSLARFGDNQDASGLTLDETRGVVVYPDADNVGSIVTWLWSERIMA